MIKPLTVPFGQRVQVTASGQYLLIREASAAFKVKVAGAGRGSQTFSLEGGDEIKVEGGFRRLTFINLSAEDDLLVDFITGNEPFNIDYVKLPRTRIVGHEIDLGEDETMDFAGVDENGKRRKQFTLTVGPDIHGGILVFDADDGTLLAIISANETAGAVTLTTQGQTRVEMSEPNGGCNIAVAETFYR
jgi:hypothetical protein